MNEQEIIQIIANSGESKMKSFEALKCVKNKDFKKAKELLKESRLIDLEAHNAQTKIIAQALDPEAKDAVTLLMVHAQDHYMTSQLARDLIEALIDVFEDDNK
ncbi:PTS lactose/cellobiose transporter subunit IIA [Granulicatella elegans]|uniref:PTS lactose/cellobiose transporter subunit IIA n=1 Tax=Granulicatella elegans TaxID=137732 RepID=UPI000AE2B831|nr:PTS lactose/cellobiose transporter subunit IIA [Granulicatella elegans]UEA31615.1 PTS lactose/cellobiose transporter subunit IIA [Granulicatella elegans]